MGKIPKCIDGRKVRGVMNLLNYFNQICGTNAKYPVIRASKRKDNLCMTYSGLSNEILINPFGLNKYIPEESTDIHLAGEIGHIVRDITNKENSGRGIIYLWLFQNKKTTPFFPINLSEFHDTLSSFVYLNLKVKNNDKFKKEIMFYKQFLDETCWNELTDNLLEKYGYTLNNDGKQIRINATGSWFERAYKTYVFTYLSSKKEEKIKKDKDFIRLEDSLRHIAVVPFLKYLEKEGLLDKKVKLSNEEIKKWFFISNEELEKMLVESVPGLEGFLIKK